jgi:hypothetical protein
MKDVGTHVALFFLISLAIAAMSAVYAEADDRAALKSLPRRFTTFVVGCAVLTAIMLACEHLFASVA